jgi:hypothetical protein
MGRIRVIFRALKLTKPAAAIQYLINNFAELVIFAREVTLLMQALEDDYPRCFASMGSAVVDAILAPPAASVQVIRTWLLELFVRGTVPIAPSELKKLYGLSSPLDQRQICLIRGRVDDKLHFRKLKTAFSQQPATLQTCVIWGASCLPKDEYRAWLTVVKPLYAGPLGDLFIRWAQKEQKTLIEKLGYSTDEHHD